MSKNKEFVDDKNNNKLVLKLYVPSTASPTRSVSASETAQVVEAESPIAL